MVLVTAWARHHCPSSGPLAPPPGIPHPSGLLLYRQDILPMSSYPAMGAPMEYNFDPMMGRPLKLLVPSTYPLLSQPLGALFSTPTSTGCGRLVSLARAKWGGMPFSGGIPISLIPSGSRQKDTHSDCVLSHSGDNPVCITYDSPQGSAPPVAM